MPVYPLPDGGVLLDPLMAASNFLVGWFAAGLYLVAFAGFANFAVQVWRLYPVLYSEAMQFRARVELPRPRLVGREAVA